MNKTFEKCCREVAEKNWPNKPHQIDWFVNNAAHHTVTQAAHLYANEKLKRLKEFVDLRIENYEQRIGTMKDSPLRRHLQSYYIAFHAIKQIIEFGEERPEQNTTLNNFSNISE